MGKVNDVNIDDWVREAQLGSNYAFTLLYETCYKDLFRFAVANCGNITVAEDIVSEAVVQAYTHIDQLRNPYAFKSWLFSIVLNECRKQMHNREYPLAVDYDIPSEENPYAETELVDLLSDMTVQERYIITMSVFLGYTSEEIAKELGLAASSVRSSKSRALQRLRKVL